MDSGIDITFSGCTCVLLLIIGSTLYCANLGDSRAIQGKQIHSQNRLEELSIDQKPDNEQEYNRIINHGGRVEPFKDYEGIK